MRGKTAAAFLLGCRGFFRRNDRRYYNVKNKGRFAAVCLAVLMLAAAMSVLYARTRPQAEIGEKCVTVEVIHKDESEKTFTYHTHCTYLGELLLAEGLIQGEEGPYGLYVTTVDGEDAVYEVDQSYWALYEGEDYAAQGIDETPLEDGDSFVLVYTIG